MEALNRLARSINYNYVFYAVTVIGMAYVSTSPVVTDPILNFCFAGIVPGTNHVMAPETMLISAIVALGGMLSAWLTLRAARRIAAAAADRRDMLAAYQQVTARPATTNTRARQLSAAPSPKGATAAAAVTAATSALTIAASPAAAPNPQAAATIWTRASEAGAASARAAAAPPAAASMFRPPSLAAGRASLHVIHRLPVAAVLYPVRALGRLWRRALCSVSSSLKWCKHTVAAAMRRLLDVLVGLLAAVLVLTQLTGSRTAMLVRRLWQWLLPRAWRLDGWLEIQCHAAAAWLWRRYGGYEIVQITAAIARDTARSLRRIFKLRSSR